MVSDDEMIEMIKKDKISLVINTPTRGKIPERLGFILRRTAIEYNIPCITSLDTARSMISILEHMTSGEETEIYSLDEYSN
ncbi:carbamoyl-phosphate synthase [Acetivibrio straminisolvens JCM 21531]|uniref:Carbamoyl-phosphate synthase n=2 Tax=Acetivibrio straminisolvens TaxID=253314 RepID=W4V5E2_9FIRM|nr:carbamoyl-phosphate synthase [Acetivibrio straminisolvens JCM 21531]